jgi:hypothetical protein
MEQLVVRWADFREILYLGAGVTKICRESLRLAKTGEKQLTLREDPPICIMTRRDLSTNITMAVVVNMVTTVSVVTMVTLLPLWSWLLTLPLILRLPFSTMVARVTSAHCVWNAKPPKLFSPRTFAVLFCDWSGERESRDVQPARRPLSTRWMIRIWSVVALVLDRENANCLLGSSENSAAQPMLRNTRRNSADSQRIQLRTCGAARHSH